MKIEENKMIDFNEMINENMESIVLSHLQRAQKDG